jgi:hypothetical protein
MPGISYLSETGSFLRETFYAFYIPVEATYKRLIILITGIFCLGVNKKAAHSPNEGVAAEVPECNDEAGSHPSCVTQ